MNIFPAIDLFAGIGGLTIAFKTVFPNAKVVVAVEKDAIAQNVYHQHFPDTPIWDDVLTFEPTQDWNYERGIVYGGFPCQDTSSAGKRKGLEGERSGLWREMRRIIRTARPAFAIIENPEGILHRGGDQILRDLAESGYDAEWQTVSARRSFGAPHWRERTFFIAYAHNLPRRQEGRSGEGEEGLQPCWANEIRAVVEKTASLTGTGQLREGIKSLSAFWNDDSERREDALRGVGIADGVPTWLGNLASAQWCAEWQPPAHPGRSKTRTTPEEKIAIWANNKAISLYGLSCCPYQVEPAFQRVKYLSECAGIQGRNSDESGDGSGDSVRREDSDSEGK